jgi:deoxyribonuclease-1
MCKLAVVITGINVGKGMTRLIIFLCCIPSFGFAAGNERIASFSYAKRLLMQEVYHDHRTTLYCDATFSEHKAITPLKGFVTAKYKKRAKKVEWEHVVPAENFGRTFRAWRDGDEQCVTRKGVVFKGRRCAEKVDQAYRLMQSDLYNLFPAIGAVNARRSNYNFVASVDGNREFGSCGVKIARNKVEPPVSARGRIARTYLYMQDTYPRYKMGKPQAKLMQAWDRLYPVSEWECQRARRIGTIQGNPNRIMTARCGLK